MSDCATQGGPRGPVTGNWGVSPALPPRVRTDWPLAPSPPGELLPVLRGWRGFCHLGHAGVGGGDAGR